jgi:anti-sigma factor (TIGR02949 family)
MTAREEPDLTGGLRTSPHLRCDEALDRLFEYLDAELGTPEAERVRAHLTECTECLEEFDVEAVVKKIVRRSCREEAPAQLRARIHEQLVTLRLHADDH